jgi:hypothetical protein
MTSPTANGTALDVRTKDGVKFGKELREKDFLFQEGYVNLNHGECAFNHPSRGTFFPGFFRSFNQTTSIFQEFLIL